MPFRLARPTDQRAMQQDAAAAAGRQHTATGTAAGASWQSLLPDDVLRLVAQHLSPAEVAVARLTCHHWRNVLSAYTQALALPARFLASPGARPALRRAAAVFPGCVALTLRAGGGGWVDPLQARLDMEPLVRLEQRDVSLEPLLAAAPPRSRWAAASSPAAPSAAATPHHNKAAATTTAMLPLGSRLCSLSIADAAFTRDPWPLEQLATLPRLSALAVAWDTALWAPGQVGRERDALAPVFDQLTQLTSLRLAKHARLLLGEAPLGDAALAGAARLAQLGRLELSVVAASDAAFAALATLTALTRLQLRGQLNISLGTLARVLGATTQLVDLELGGLVPATQDLRSIVAATTGGPGRAHQQQQPQEPPAVVGSSGSSSSGSSWSSSRLWQQQQQQQRGGQAPVPATAGSSSSSGRRTSTGTMQHPWAADWSAVFQPLRWLRRLALQSELALLGSCAVLRGMTHVTHISLHGSARFVAGGAFTPPPPCWVTQVAAEAAAAAAGSVAQGGEHGSSAGGGNLHSLQLRPGGAWPGLVSLHVNDLQLADAGGFLDGLAQLASLHTLVLTGPLMLTAAAAAGGRQAGGGGADAATMGAAGGRLARLQAAALQHGGGGGSGSSSLGHTAGDSLVDSLDGGGGGVRPRSGQGDAAATQQTIKAAAAALATALAAASVEDASQPSGGSSGDSSGGSALQGAGQRRSTESSSSASPHHRHHQQRFNTSGLQQQLSPAAAAALAGLQAAATSSSSSSPSPRAFLPVLDADVLTRLSPLTQLARFELLPQQPLPCGLSMTPFVLQHLSVSWTGLQRLSLALAADSCTPAAATTPQSTCTTAQLLGSLSALTSLRHLQLALCRDDAVGSGAPRTPAGAGSLSPHRGGGAHARRQGGQPGGGWLPATPEGTAPPLRGSGLSASTASSSSGSGAGAGGSDSGAALPWDQLPGSLESLSLVGFTGLQPDNISQLASAAPALRHLRLLFCQAPTALLWALPRCLPQLATLAVQEHSCWGIGSSGVAALVGLTSLRALAITVEGGTDVEALGALGGSLRHLLIHGRSHAELRGVKGLRQLSRLRTLILPLLHLHHTRHALLVALQLALPDTHIAAVHRSFGQQHGSKWYACLTERQREWWAEPEQPWTWQPLLNIMP